VSPYNGGYCRSYRRPTDPLTVRRCCCDASGSHEHHGTQTHQGLDFSSPESFVDADLDYLLTTGTGNTPLSVAALLSIESKLRMQRGAILPRLILGLVPTTECLPILRFVDLCPTNRLSSFYLHLGRLCSSRLWSFDHSAPPAVPSTPSFIPFLPTISATSTPGAKTTSNAPLQVLHETSDAPLQVITAPHPSTGTTPRSLSAQHDSTAPDSALPNALFSSRVRSSGTGEGDYGEQTQDNLFFDDGLTSFPAVRPDLVQFFLWNAMSGRLVACPTSRIMSFHSTRRIFAPLIAFPATTWLSVVDIHLAILNRGNSVVY
jgi:hypothetical protein